MTDTPRSLADILELFSDDDSPVSRQDLRDAIVSITSPIDNGGFGPVVGAFVGTPTTPGLVTVTGEPTVPRTPMTYDTPTADEDPMGWFQDTPYVSSWWGGITFDTWFLLPPGLYIWSIYADFHTGHLNEADATMDNFMSTLDDPTDFDWMHGGRSYFEPQVGAMYKPGTGTDGDNGEGCYAQGFMRVPRLDNNGDPVTAHRFGIIYRLKGQADLQVGVRNLGIMRIGG